MDQIDPAELAGEYPAVEYVPPHGRYSLDILTRLGEAFRHDDVAAGSEVARSVTWRSASPRPASCTG